MVDIRAVVESLKKMDKERSDQHTEHVEMQQTARGNKKRHAKGHYKNSHKHSLAKHGKTHAVC